MSHYLLVVAVVFGINLMPAFAPPTWAVLVLFRINSNLASVPLVLLGAISAGAGRYCLALVTRKFRNKIPSKARANLEAAGELLSKNKKSAFLGIGLFALSPLPSAQLFEAAGLINTPLFALTIAFFMGRIVSYSIYIAGAAKLADNNLGEIFTSSLKSPAGIALQIAAIFGIYLITKIDWRKFHSR